MFSRSKEIIFKYDLREIIAGMPFGHASMQLLEFGGSQKDDSMKTTSPTKKKNILDLSTREKMLKLSSQIDKKPQENK